MAKLDRGNATKEGTGRTHGKAIQSTPRDCAPASASASGAVDPRSRTSGGHASKPAAPSQGGSGSVPVIKLRHAHSKDPKPLANPSEKHLSPNDPTRRIRVLHLFSGPADRPDGLSAYLRSVGIDTKDCDIINEHLEEQDLVDDAVWQRIMVEVRRGDYDFIFLGPPCRTYSLSRQNGTGPGVAQSRVCWG